MSRLKRVGDVKTLQQAIFQVIVSRIELQTLQNAKPRFKTAIFHFRIILFNMTAQERKWSLVDLINVSNP